MLASFDSFRIHVSELFLNLTTEGKKKRDISCAEEDRISNLPQHLIDSILEPLYVQDVVRTSILSKKWRYKWTTTKALRFHEQFFKRFAKDGAFGGITIINKVLTLHTGPISKFLLRIPSPYVLIHMVREFDQWMQLLSRNGVKELVLLNCFGSYKLPAHFFSCLELTKLDPKNFH
ncbi:hypothetical protein LXL04_033508 [Taraxacum kok-saghyz]